MDLILTNIGVLATPLGKQAQKGPAQQNIFLQEEMAVGMEGETIAWVGPARKAPKAKEVLDCRGGLVTPGLVDAHTHLTFGGWRHHEMAQKLAGMDYLDILRAGGGILSTVAATRAASLEELVEKGTQLLEEMLSFGTTTCEVKSGYGLSTQEELKQLQVTRSLGAIQPIELVSTFMGAHAIPAEYKENREGYLALLCDEMLPAVWESELAEYCDVFCETAVFSIEETRQILQRARELGFDLKGHMDEIDPIGGAELAGEMGLVSAEHLIQASDSGIQAMAKAGTVAVLLPCTSFYLDKPYARARDMIAAGTAVAVATDFNPGSSPNLNLQLAMNLACLKYKLTPAQALTAVTLNGAAAIGRAEQVGSIEVGKQADLLIWNAPDLDYIFYRYGSNLVNTVIKKGTVALTR